MDGMEGKVPHDVDQGDLPHRNEQVGTFVELRPGQNGDDPGDDLQKDVLKTVRDHKSQDEHGQHMGEQSQSGIEKVFKHQGQDAQRHHIDIVLIVFDHQGGCKDHEQDVEEDEGELVVVPVDLEPVALHEEQ